MAGGFLPRRTTSRIEREVVIRDLSIANGSAGKHKGAGPTMTFNLKAVVEACEAAGYDPMEEILRVLKDPAQKGIDAKTRMAVNLSLIEHYQPKLKAVEVKNTTKMDPEAVRLQLEALLSKAKKKK